VRADSTVSRSLEGIEEARNRSPIPIVAHAMDEADDALTVDDEVSPKLKHVWSHAEKAFTRQEESEVPPVQRRRQHRPEQVGSPQAPGSIRRSVGVEEKGKRKLEIVEHLRFHQTLRVVGHEQHHGSHSLELTLPL
jgi:hypothetical protein